MPFAKGKRATPLRTRIECPASRDVGQEITVLVAIARWRNGVGQSEIDVDLVSVDQCRGVTKLIGLGRLPELVEENCVASHHIGRKD